MSKLKDNYLVKKRNVLNEIRANNMTLQELRFFSIYLSKINSNDVSTRVVRFSISDFQVIMELESRLKMDDMERVANSLLCKVVKVPDEVGGFAAFQLFKECVVSKDKNGEWYVEIDAHDKALPLMFEFKSRFFSYKLWNALRLKSSNQLRMYEILKQYEHVGSRVLSIDELKELLGIKKDEYLRFANFKTRVLDACQQALKEYTDIQFTYEPYERKGLGGKVFSLKFDIEKNEDYVDQLTLSMFIDEHNENTDDKVEESDEELVSVYDEKIDFLAEACGNEFTPNEIIVLYKEMQNKLPFSLIRDEIKCYDYLNDKYREMIMRNDKIKINHRFAYLRSIIGKDFEP